jgi:hypothetical protein
VKKIDLQSTPPPPSNSFALRASFWCATSGAFGAKFLLKENRAARANSGALCVLTDNFGRIAPNIPTKSCPLQNGSFLSDFSTARYMPRNQTGSNIKLNEQARVALNMKLKQRIEKPNKHIADA